MAAAHNHHEIVGLLTSEKGNWSSQSRDSTAVAATPQSHSRREKGGLDMVALLAAAIVAMYLQQVRALLYTISNATRRTPDNW